MTTNLEVLNKVIPFRHLLDGNCPVGDYLLTLSKWLRRYREVSRIIDPVTVKDISRDPGETSVQELRPGIEIAQIIENFLSSECQMPNGQVIVRIGYHPEYGIPLVGECTYEARTTLCLTPLGIKLKQRPAMPFQGFGDASSSVDMEKTGVSFAEGRTRLPE